MPGRLTVRLNARLRRSRPPPSTPVGLPTGAPPGRRRRCPTDGLRPGRPTLPKDGPQPDARLAHGGRLSTPRGYFRGVLRRQPVHQREATASSPGAALNIIVSSGVTAEHEARRAREARAASSPRRTPTGSPRPWRSRNLKVLGRTSKRTPRCALPHAFKRALGPRRRHRGHVSCFTAQGPAPPWAGLPAVGC